MVSLTPAPTPRPHHSRNAETGLRQPSGGDLVRFVARLARLRCPHCGKGPVLTRRGAVKTNCRACGLRFERTDDNYFSGAMFFGLMIGEVMVVLFIALTMVVTWPNVPWDGIQWGGAVGMVLLAPLLIPFSRVVWLAVDVLVRPVVPEELGEVASAGDAERLSGYIAQP